MEDHCASPCTWSELLAIISKNESTGPLETERQHWKLVVCNRAPKIPEDATSGPCVYMAEPVCSLRSLARLVFNCHCDHNMLSTVSAWNYRPFCSVCSFVFRYRCILPHYCIMYLKSFADFNMSVSGAISWFNCRRERKGGHCRSGGAEPLFFFFFLLCWWLHMKAPTLPTRLEDNTVPTSWKE